MNTVITLIASLISASVTLFVYYKVRNNPISKERLEKLYVPLFNMLESSLFNYVPSIETKDKKYYDAFNFLKENLAYADGELIEFFYSFINEKDPIKKKSYFDDVSNRIVTMCNRLSLKIGNGGFTPAFRYNQNLYIKGRMNFFKVEFALYFFVLPFIGFLTIAFLFFIFISNSSIFFDGIINLFK